LTRSPLKRESLRILRERAIPVVTVLDVGVLKGTPELLEAFPDIPHLLFEPVSEFIEHIEKAYAGTPHRIVSCAVSDRSGEVSLGTVSIIPGLPISHAFMTEIPAQATRTVPMISLDDFLSTNPAAAPYLLKIDIDGHEMKVLRGAGATLKQTSVVIIETPVGAIVERLAFLEQAGFRLFDLTEPCYYDESFWCCDAVLIRRDIHDERFADIRRNFDVAKYQIFK
jgi:FkbM family methyltransferase